MENTVQLVILFDGSCHFCTACAELLRMLDGRHRLSCLPFQAPGVPQSYGLTVTQCEQVVWAISSDGRRYQGAQAMSAALDAIFDLPFFLLLSLARLCHPYLPHDCLPHSRAGAVHPIVQRLLKPRTPCDCPACRLSPPSQRLWGHRLCLYAPGARSKAGGEPRNAETPRVSPVPTTSAPTSGSQMLTFMPWLGMAPMVTQNRSRPFVGLACRTTFSARRHTPLYRLKPPSQQIAVVLTAQAYGLDPSEARRVFGYHQATITTWLSREGSHAQTLHEHYFCNLQLPHLQLDEIRTRLRSSTQVLWLWLAIDPLTKILPVLQLGPRTQHAAHMLIHSLRQILAPGCLPLFTSDGLNVYFYALTAHFGQWLEVGRRGRKVRQWQVATGLISGQVKKSYRRRKLVRVTRVMRLGTGAALTVARPRTGPHGSTQHCFH